jgi:hypothetical protein
VIRPTGRPHLCVACSGWGSSRPRRQDVPLLRCSHVLLVTIAITGSARKCMGATSWNLIPSMQTGIGLTPSAAKEVAATMLAVRGLTGLGKGWAVSLLAHGGKMVCGGAMLPSNTCQDLSMPIHWNQACVERAVQLLLILVPRQAASVSILVLAPLYTVGGVRAGPLKRLDLICGFRCVQASERRRASMRMVVLCMFPSSIGRPGVGSIKGPSVRIGVLCTLWQICRLIIRASYPSGAALVGGRG